MIIKKIWNTLSLIRRHENINCYQIISSHFFFRGKWNKMWICSCKSFVIWPPSRRISKLASLVFCKEFHDTFHNSYFIGHFWAELFFINNRKFEIASKLFYKLTKIAPQNGLLLFVNLVFFNLLFVCPRSILSHYCGNSFTHPISITAVEFLSTAEILDGDPRRGR